MIVEIWTIGSINSKSYVLLEPHDKNGSFWVINGCYELKPDKEKNQVYIPYTGETHESHYLGDVMFDEDYNKTIQNYEDTKEIVGVNTVKIKEQKENDNTFNEDETPF